MQLIFCQGLTCEKSITGNKILVFRWVMHSQTMQVKPTFCFWLLPWAVSTERSRRWPLFVSAPTPARASWCKDLPREPPTESETCHTHPDHSSAFVVNHATIFLTSSLITMQTLVVVSHTVLRMDCSCAPILRFFSVASDGATTERQIYNRVFWSISYQFEEG